ncbi:LLM class flavin-dependent oxidoreductase [Nocardia uniformis]|uniref:LLM class flavin-dependent oxidoreductase n=1 Tax=Nocardia uniformis TaxID=53432 RepID=A0A849BY59_9NOCA|nr:LLM class flavin-dependent oxidoreductase [Nocardia uniformis]NNH68607.1 LLM class flavin-dependent oxidoreductase [Nocardia uniformis]
MTIEIGVFLPTSTPDPEQPILGDIRASARLAEDLDLGSIWATDHLVASAPILDSTVALATAAAVTDRIRIGYGVMLLALRPAAWAAKQISTLQYVSGDRLLVGVGTGNPAHGDTGWRAADRSFTERGRRTDEALRLLPDLVAGRTTTVAGGLEVTLAPGSTVPPILVAGDGSRARNRAAAHGDGWITIAPSLNQLTTAADELRELATRYDRPTPAITVVAPSLSAVIEQAAEQLSDLAAVGVERVILAPSGPNWAQNYEFAAKVRSAL